MDDELDETVIERLKELLKQVEQLDTRLDDIEARIRQENNSPDE